MPQIWFGATCPGWLLLLHENNFAVDATYIPWAALISGQTLWNSLFFKVQESWWGARIRETKIVADPVFILGHWRFRHHLAS